MSMYIKVGIVLLPLLFSLIMLMLYTMAKTVNSNEDAAGFTKLARYGFIIFVVFLIGLLFTL